MIDIQTTCAKVSSQDENSREHILRSLMIIKWNKGCNKLYAAVKWAW